MMQMIDRRSLLQSVLLLAGVVVAPGAAAASFFDGTESLPANTMTLLSAVADTIIPATDTPGALAAGVPAAFGKLVANWASPAQRAQLLGALEAIDAKAGGFVALSPAKRFEMLDAYDRANPGIPPIAKLKDEQDKGSAGSPGYAKVKEAQEKAEALTPDYAKLKELIVTLYYLSEVGATVELRYEHAPGAWQPSLPLTAETRVEGGPASF
jgi:gluconate 2-dehydrogenase gamma chain